MRNHPMVVVVLGVCAALVGACSASTSASAGGIAKIKHVVVIMQENRSFDTYFGTYPGAAGIPMSNGQPSVCLPNASGGCDKPFHDSADVNSGGPHGQDNATADINGGKMDGFVLSDTKAAKGCVDPNSPACSNGDGPDVMGWKDAREIPNYWTYAHDFVLQDHMFEPNASWSLPEHLFMVSEWSASCAKARDPASCVNALQNPARPNAGGGTKKPKAKGSAPASGPSLRRRQRPHRLPSISRTSRPSRPRSTRPPPPPTRPPTRPPPRNDPLRHLRILPV